MKANVTLINDTKSSLFVLIKNFQQENYFLLNLKYLENLTLYTIFYFDVQMGGEHI